jgi:anti-sigma regulatory factor (Ser/Thr protein kinase)
MTTHSLDLLSNGASSVGGHWLKSAVEMAAGQTGSWPLAADRAAADVTGADVTASDVTAPDVTAPDVTAPGWSGCERMVTRKPGATAGAVRAARHFTIATLRQWNLAGRSEDIALVVSELLTNAVRHAAPGASRTASRSPIRLGLIQPGPCILCAVADPSELVPVPREPDYLAETGRGLHVIGALSDTWGYTSPGTAGKVVWAMFRLSS